MKRWTRALFAALLAAPLWGGCARPARTQSDGGARFQNVTLRMLNCWNSEIRLPENQTDNAVANAIRGRIGVTVILEGSAMNEEDRLRLVFASGDMPDIINAPFWSEEGGATAIIKKAAADGRLSPLDDAIAPYENLADAWKVGVVAQSFLENDLEDERFQGRHYILPTETPGNERNVLNWGYGVFARGDIVAALGVETQSVRTPDDLYRFLTAVRDGGFTDTQGEPVIPASTFHDGWDRDSLCTGFNQPNITQLRPDGAGGCTLYVLTEDWLQKQMFLRRLVKERLLDAECFKQGDMRAWEKVSTGAAGVFALQYRQVIEAAQKTGLYAAHPEMRYIPLGPLTYSDDRTTRVQPELDGRNGSPCSVFPASGRNLDAALAFFDYCNSEEGLRLISYGLEGEDYVTADGRPRLRAEDLERLRAGDAAWETRRVNRGIGVFTQRVVLADKRMDWFGETNPGDAEASPDELRSYGESVPVRILDGYPLDKLVLDYPRYDALSRLKPEGDSEATAVEKAYFAPSDEEALRILRGYQERLRTAGDGLMQDFLRYAGEKARSRDDVLW